MTRCGFDLSTARGDPGRRCGPSSFRFWNSRPWLIHLLSDRYVSRERLHDFYGSVFPGAEIDDLGFALGMAWHRLAQHGMGSGSRLRAALAEHAATTGRGITSGGVENNGLIRAGGKSS